MCGGHINGITIYTVDKNESDIGRWKFKHPVSAADALPLTLTDSIDSSFSPTKEYSAYAWSLDDSSSAAGPDFKGDALRGIKVGEVLYLNPDNFKKNKVAPLAQFKKDGCAFLAD